MDLAYAGTDADRIWVQDQRLRHYLKLNQHHVSTASSSGMWPGMVAIGNAPHLPHAN